jgi:hypothetical protein
MYLGHWKSKGHTISFLFSCCLFYELRDCLSVFYFVSKNSEILLLKASMKPEARDGGSEWRWVAIFELFLRLAAIVSTSVAVYAAMGKMCVTLLAYTQFLPSKTKYSEMLTFI